MKQENNFKEDRRIFERFAVTLPAKMIDLDAGNERVIETCDVSAKGIGAISKDYLKVGNRLKVWINVNDGREPFYTDGWVMWSGQQGTGKYRSGILLEKAELMGMSRIFRSQSLAPRTLPY